MGLARFAQVEPEPVDFRLMADRVLNQIDEGFRLFETLAGIQFWDLSDHQREAFSKFWSRIYRVWLGLDDPQEDFENFCSEFLVRTERLLNAYLRARNLSEKKFFSDIKIT